MSPFLLSNPDAYQRWRDEKLSKFPSSISDLMVEIRDLNQLSLAEKTAIRGCVKRAGFALYKGPVEASKENVQALGEQFGLVRLDHNPYADDDAISSLQASHDTGHDTGHVTGRKMYIPYTNKALNWHTDGYYNEPHLTIQSMILHCVRSAGLDGGTNQFFDPEMAYLLMREADLDWIKALQNKTAMTIPGNADDDFVQRGDSSGPVFSVHKASGSLQMRYTARKRHVIWADDKATTQAVDFLQNLLGGPYTFKHRLEPGEGLISTNILHTRSRFEDGDNQHQKRLMLRARFYDRLVL
ncbi:MAG: TauD/TfdA family dioxygenase [Magnetovibrio sp.]|nr:TauD/TfdA family dioxygenase [Magnetovibrio sp.]